MDEDELYANSFKDILNTFNLIQHVNFPTHIAGHTLDIIATLEDNPIISNIEANKYDISHHFLVDFNVSVSLEAKEFKTISYRDINGIKVDVFTQDITDGLNITDAISFKENINSYNEVMNRVLNEHAPLKSKNVKIVPTAPWFDCEYEQMRRLRRKAEKKYKQTGLIEHKEEYRNLRKQTTDLARQKKLKYYSDKLKSNNSKTLYFTINQLLDKNQDVILPDTNSENEMANSFMKHFTNKIEKIRDTFEKETQSNFNALQNADVSNKLLIFEAATSDEILQIVLSYGVKCSPEDPIPANPIKKNIDVFLPIWTKLVNLSLAEGSIDCLKSAVLLPLIKDIDNYMDRDNLNNYRPVSNLQFVGKLIERIVDIRLNRHMMYNNLHSIFQYGYKKGHSTETLLLNMVNDLLVACDNQMPTIVMLLDLSAAFDTVDQTKLLHILHYEIGIDGIALKWFESFLKGRTQRVKIGNSYSEEANLNYGVPQGSVLGPNLFNIYIRSLHKYMEPAKFSIFGYADDHQLLKSFLPVLQVKALGEDISHCFDLITLWMNDFFLRLNANKTKILLIMPPSLRSKIIIRGTFINNNCVRFVHSAKNLGVVLDDELTFEIQIIKIVKSCFDVIRKLSKIKAFLTYEQLRTAVCAFIFSKLDYCNALYYGVNCHLLDKLQSVQNSAARLLKKKIGFNDLSIHGYIKKCHWLRVKERIIFKTCLLVHKCLYGVAPASLVKLITYSSSSRTMLLTQYPYKSSFGDRSFSRVGPKLWNLLPMNIRMETNTNKFKSTLKTFLFDGQFLLNER